MLNLTVLPLHLCVGERMCSKNKSDIMAAFVMGNFLDILIHGVATFCYTHGLTTVCEVPVGERTFAHLVPSSV